MNICRLPGGMLLHQLILVSLVPQGICLFVVGTWHTYTIPGGNFIKQCKLLSCIHNTGIISVSIFDMQKSVWNDFFPWMSLAIECQLMMSLVTILVLVFM